MEQTQSVKESPFKPKVTVGTNICILNFFVVNGVQNGILELDALDKLGVTLNTRGKSATINETQLPPQSELPNARISPKCYHIRVALSCDIQPFEERFIWGKHYNTRVYWRYWTVPPENWSPDSPNTNFFGNDGRSIKRRSQYVYLMSLINRSGSLENKLQQLSKNLLTHTKYYSTPCRRKIHREC